MANPSGWEEEFINSLAAKPIEAICPLYYPHIEKEAAAAISPLHSTIEIQPERTGTANKNHLYDPTTVAMGPYHQGRLPQYRKAEELKTEVLNMRVASEGKGSLFRQLLERVDEIRDFYGPGISKHDFDDKALAEMMLHDACFLLYLLEGVAGDHVENIEHVSRRVGYYRKICLYSDLLMLENQIPFWTIKLLISQIYTDHDDQKTLLCKALGFMCYASFDAVTQVPWEEEPLHLLEAFRATLLMKHMKSNDNSNNNNIRKRIKGQCRRIKRYCRPIFKIVFALSSRIKLHCCPIFKIFKLWKCSDAEDSSLAGFKYLDRPFRSVTYLKAKGIQFGPSSPCLAYIEFKSYGCYAKLLLPVSFIGVDTQVTFANIIVFELSPESDVAPEVISYVNFMKALLESPNDVKELREKGILFSEMADEEVLKTFKELETFGYTGATFDDTRDKINKHCASKAKTWMAELIHSNFRNPWTAMALVSAAILLCLTFLQTFYTINPRD